MFKARKKDVRRRVMAKKPIDEESEDSDVSVGTAPAPPQQKDSGEGRAKKMRKKVKDKKDKGPKPVLSFGHEDEDDKGEGDAVFRVKKTKASKAMAKAARDKTELAVSRKDSSAQGSWQTATAGMYTAEGLAALRSSQAFTPKPSSGARRERRVRGGGGGFREGEGEGGGEQRVFAGDEAEVVHEAERQGDLVEGLGEEQMQRLKGQLDARDAAARDARRKDSDDGEDFIPLDGKVPLPGSLAAAGGGVNGDDGGAMDDEEQQRWEEEQVRRGATRSKATTGSTLSNPNPGLPSKNASFGAYAMTPLNGGVFGGAGRGGTVGGERPHFMGVDEMQKALREAEKRLRETHERNERQLQMVVSEIATQTAEQEKIASQKKKAAECFSFFQRTRNALSDLCGMLREKESMLSEVESAQRLLHARRLERSRRSLAEDQEDSLLDAKDAGAKVVGLGPYRPWPNGPLSRESSAEAKATVEAGRAERRETRIRRRKERRKRIRKRVLGGAGEEKGREGWVGSESFPWGEREREEIWEALDSEEDGGEGIGDGGSERERKVWEAAEMVMEDVDDDVKSLSAVKMLFEDWKRRYGEQYAQAYCTLTLPELLAPFVRLELIRWNPLNGTVGGTDDLVKNTEDKKEDTKAGGGSEGGAGDETDEGEDDLGGVLERFEWYRRLFDFSFDIPPPGSAGYSAEEDPDQNLVPQLVEKVAVPLVAERLSMAYNAMSRRQTACLTTTVSELLVYDPSEAALEKLLGSALEALKMAVETLCIPTIGPSPTWEGRAAAISLVRIQACRGLKLLRNCLAWRDLLSPESLVPLALGNLVAKRLVPALHGLTGLGPGGVSKAKGQGGAGEALALCERAVELLPIEWTERADASAARASLKVIARLFGDNLLKDVGVFRTGGGGKGKGETVERVVKLHAALGDHGAAKELAHRHGLKIVA